MKITKIEWKNFGSYGNRKQILDFPEKSCLFQIIGSNGAGKTTISQVISFCLYGKIEGKKLGDIPNRINGNAWTRIDFENNNKKITVERGLAPSVFSLYVNDELYDQAGNKNIQEYLSEDLIGIPYYVFNNTISLSINDFKSFIKMSPQDKRDIIDKIFGFHILNQMREILKGEFRKIKTELDSLNGSLLGIDRSMDESNRELEFLLSSLEEESAVKIESLNSSLGKFIDLKKIHKEKFEDFNLKESETRETSRNLNSTFIESRSRFNEIEKKLKLYDLEKCPTCGGHLDSEFHTSVKESLEESKLKEKEILDSFKKEIDDIKNIETDLNNTKKDLLEKGFKIDSKIREIESEIKKAESKNPDVQVSSLKRIIDKLKTDKENIGTGIFNIEEKNRWIKKLDDIIGERGVKQMAIRTILPSLNSEILNLLKDMNLEYQVLFDEEFKASLHHMGMEIPVSSLSTGEMKKVDFAVLISIVKLMKIKFSNINLLFLDELFSSVDPEGIYSIVNILKGSTKDLGLNIFVINHAPMPHEIFDWKLEVSKINNFSSIAIDKF